jgi:hypothetical protein
MIPPHVRLWHKADIQASSGNVRFWGNSGHHTRLVSKEKMVPLPPYCQANQCPCRACRGRRRDSDGGRWTSAAWSNPDDRALSWRQRANGKTGPRQPRRGQLGGIVGILADNQRYRSNRFASNASAANRNDDSDLGIELDQIAPNELS